MPHAPPVATVHGVAWHPDGRHLATGCDDNKIHVWDTESAAEVMAPWEGHIDNGISLAFNRTGDRLASTDWGGQFHLWDATTGQLLLTMPGSGLVQFGR